MVVYKRPEHPEIDLGKVASSSIPIALIAGKTDSLATVEDVEILVQFLEGKGKHIAYTAGTGVLVFLDLVAFLLIKMIELNGGPSIVAHRY